MGLTSEKTLVLCGGLQSSGTTLISYCFLQRTDIDGVLDADNDLLPSLDPHLARPYAWYKTTISCFRLSELAQHYRDSGWEVRTLLVIRDLRNVWSSLRKKPYGLNGITAEDPPLRLRVRRFVDEWQQAAHNGTALLRYEDFVTSPETVLRQACDQLSLSWDPAMLSWPKAPDQIADPKNGNGSFWTSRDANLMQTLARYRQTPEKLALPANELQWLESEFRDFNVVSGYPLHRDATLCAPDDELTLAPPSFEFTRRYKWETTQKPFRWLLARFGRRNQTLIDRRSWKRAA